MDSSLQMFLTKAFMPGPQITVTVYTVGGTDDDGNDIEEPIVFDGRYNDAVKFFENGKNLDNIQQIVDGMPDPYITVECGNYSRDVHDPWEIMEAIEEMY